MYIYLIWYWEDKTAQWISENLYAVEVSLTKAKEYGNVTFWYCVPEKLEFVGYEKDSIGLWTIQGVEIGKKCSYPSYPIDVISEEQYANLFTFS